MRGIINLSRCAGAPRCGSHFAARSSRSSENGAGKITLMKILGGAQRADAGIDLHRSRHRHARSPHDSRRAASPSSTRSSTSCPASACREYFPQARKRRRVGFISTNRNASAPPNLSAGSGSRSISMRPAGNQLTTAQQQLVEIAKALAFEAARIIVMDEPSAALTPA